jgi:hypothetical protein
MKYCQCFIKTLTFEKYFNFLNKGNEMGTYEFPYLNLGFFQSTIDIVLGENRNGPYGVKQAHPTKNKNKIFPP